MSCLSLFKQLRFVISYYSEERSAKIIADIIYEVLEDQPGKRQEIFEKLKKFDDV